MLTDFQGNDFFEGHVLNSDVRERAIQILKELLPHTNPNVHKTL